MSTAVAEIAELSEYAATLERLVRRALEGPWRVRPSWDMDRVAICSACGGLGRPLATGKESVSSVVHAPDCPGVEAARVVNGGGNG